MSSDAPLSTYGDLADVLDSLTLLLRETRRIRRLSLRAAAEQIGVSYSTLSRIETSAGDAVLGNVIAVMRWLDAPIPIDDRTRTDG